MTLQRRHWKLALWMLPVLLIAAMIVSQWQLPAQAQGAEGSGQSTKRTVSVTGEGKVTVEPDIAFIHLGVVTEGKTAEAAQSANADIFAKVREVLFEQFAMKEKDVQTISFRVRPNYVYKEGEDPEISSYTATQTIQISYRELSRIGEVLDAVAKAGVNRVDSVQFATEKAEQYQLEALQAAMKNARQKAEALAAAENETIKGVVSITQHGSGGSLYYNDYARASFEASAVSDSAVSSVNPGEIVVNAQVGVVYEF